MSDQDQEELKQLLDSLQSSDVMQVKKSKQQIKVVDQKQSDEEKRSNLRVKPSFLNLEQTQVVSPSKRFSKNSEITGVKPAYVPAFLTNKFGLGSGSNKPYLYTGDRDSNHNPIVGQNIIGQNYKPMVNSMSVNPLNGISLKHLSKPLVNGVAHMSKANVPLANGHIPGKVQFTRETVTNFSSKMDFKTKVVESYTDPDLSQTISQTTSGSYPGLLSKFRSLPNIKSDSLVGSKKMIHSHSPFSTYLPSAMESQGNPPKPKARSVYVRTDWKAKYLN